ncbi:hypothetical protein TruAng_001292 [Truncatella angustata]|nr:hypothetical protein TruAng_001292 [Truncatella angustata]
MQVLSSPSRKEIDHTHEYLKSLDIGIPSVKNIRFISPFKQICWAILLLSSFPLHLIFNSAVFETGYQGSYWNLTIATEAFTQGAGFYAPGASLSPAGSPSPAYIRSTVGQPEHQPTPVWKAKGGIDGYGQSLDIADYWDENSLPRLELAATALVADSWSRLDPKTCLAEYRSCNPRKNYGNVVVVVNSSASSAAGWTRSEVFHFDPQSNLSSIWDSHIPPNVTNSLWYSAQCKVTRSTNPSVYDHCEHTCLNVLGLNHTKTYDVSTKAPDNTQWTLSFQPVELNIAPSVRESLGYNDTFNSLDVNYCLALPVNKCKIGVSNTLVLIVLVCILVKLLTCVMVIRNLTHHMSLITPGDAMESFISRPDTRTEGLGTLDITDSERLEFGPRTLSTEASSDLTQIIRPRRWQTKPRRYIGMVPRAAWTRTYCLLFCAIVFLVVCVALALDGGRSPLIPLLAVSILLHWLVSNSVYIFITEGGYWEIEGTVEGAASYFGVSDDAIVAIGYSPPAILVMLVVSVVISIFPALWGLRKVKGDMTFTADQTTAWDLCNSQRGNKFFTPEAIDHDGPNCDETGRIYLRQGSEDVSGDKSGVHWDGGLNEPVLIE